MGSGGRTFSLRCAADLTNLIPQVAFIENEEKIKKYLKDKEDEEAQALKEVSCNSLVFLTNSER